VLDLQSRHIKDQSVKEQFKLAQDRIILMAMVHDKLYQSEDFSKINFDRYIKDLTDSLHQLHGKEDHKISLKRKIENVSIGIEKVIPLKKNGMII